MKRILSSILVIAMLLTMLPTALAGAAEYQIATSETAYTGKVNETISVPVYFQATADATIAKDLTVVAFSVFADEALTATVTSGLVESNSENVSVFPGEVLIFQDKAISASNAAPLFTLEYTAATAGTYEVKFDYIEIFDANSQPITSIEGVKATITVTAGETPVAPTLTGIAANITEFEVPYGADALAAVKAAITTVTATYSDNTTAPVTDYTVALEGAALAVVEYQGCKAEIALTYEPAPAPTLTGIEVTPDELTVPVEFQSDVKTYVQDKITKVVATYSDNSTAEIQNGYEVTVDGTTAIVTYEGKTDTIALTLAVPTPQPPVSDYDYQIVTGAAEYTGKVNETISVPVYFQATADPAVAKALTVVAFSVFADEALTATVTSGLVESNSENVSVFPGEVLIFQDKAISASNAAPLFTLEYTAATAGTYEVKFDYIEIFDANSQPITSIEGVKATITVTAEGGETPVVPTLTGITVNPTAVEVPYGADDAKVAVKNAITGVTAVYSDGTSATVTGWDVEISADGSKAVVKYEDAEAEIVLTYASAPVTDVEIIVGVTEITVPYGTADVEAYVKANVGEVKVKDSKDVERVVTDAEVVYADGYVTVSYGSITPVQIPVKVITLDSYALADGTPESIEIPYDVTDVNAYVAGKIEVVGNLSDGTTVAVTDFTVEVGEAVATVKVGDVEVGTVAVTYGKAPVAAITAIEIVAADAIIVPYGVEDINAYIQSKIVVNTIDENNEIAATTEYTLTYDDGVATVTYKDNTELTDTVEYTLETVTITASKETIEIPYTVAEEDYAKYIAENVTFAVDYSADTVDETVTVKPEQVEIDVDFAVITVKEGEIPVEIRFTVQPKPEYVAEVITPAYNLEGKSLVKITGVADGKAAVVDGIEATYFGNGTFAVVVDSDKVEAIELVAVAAMPAVAEFGKLHDANVSAFDALQANDEALGKEGVTVFDNIQMYVIADINGDGKIEAADAYGINQISLYDSTKTWVSAE